MDISQIPRTFWHAISLAILLLTIGFLVIAYKSTSISIQIANTKIALSQAAAQVKEASAELSAKAKALQDLEAAMQGQTRAPTLGKGTELKNHSAPNYRTRGASGRSNSGEGKTLDEIQADLQKIDSNTSDVLNRIRAIK